MEDNQVIPVGDTVFENRQLRLVGDITTPADVFLAQREALGQELITAESHIAAVVKGAVERDKDLRSGARFGVDQRYELERDAYYNVDIPATDLITGEVLDNDINKHRKAGLSLGLYADAVNVVAPKIVDGLLGNSKIPVMFEPYGTRQENPQKQEGVTAVAIRHAEKAGWKDQVTAAVWDIYRHGTGVLRQSWSEKVELVRQEDGTFKEQVTHRGMCIEHWPLLAVYVSNPERRYAWQQDHVIFEDVVTLSDLEASERRASKNVEIYFDPMTGMPIPVPGEETRGEYFNLDVLRKSEADRMEAAFANVQEARGTDRTSSSELKERTTHQYSYRRYRFQGYFPIAGMLKTEQIKPEHFFQWSDDLYSINEHGEITGLLADSEDIDALARFAEQVKWYITVLEPIEGEGEPLVIGLKPCPYRKQRNELYHGALFTDGFYGYGAYHIAGDLNEAADQIYNALIDIVDNNSDPTKFVDMNSGIVKQGDDIQNLFERGKVRPANLDEGKRMQDVFYEHLLPFDRNSVDLLERTIQFHGLRTMASQQDKGGEASTESNTLGEAELQVRGNERRLAMIIRHLAETMLVVPSFEDWLEDFDWFLTNEEQSEEVRRALGTPGLDIQKVWATHKDITGETDRVYLNDEFIVRHVGDASIRKEVATQMLMKIAEMAPLDPRIDIVEILKSALDNIDVKYDKIFREQKKPVSPEDELKAIIQVGDAIEVPENEPMGAHAPVHQLQLVSLDTLIGQLAAMGEDVSVLMEKREVLANHFIETQKHDEQLMALMLQEQLLMAQAQQPPAKGNSGQPKGQDEAANQMAGQAANPLGIPANAPVI